MKAKKITLAIIGIAASMSLATTTMAKTNDSMNHDSMNMNMSKDSMNMSQLQSNLKKAKHAKFKDGQKITVLANHMNGMKDAKGSVVAAYDTPLYEVSYMPTNGGSMVMNHKWVTYKDFKDMKKTHKVGNKVVLTSDHMDGMKGATATINAIEKAPAYVINYQPTNGDMMVKNHGFVSQNEIKAR